ncbi:guanine nucleotide exchange factor for Rab-3A isoform X4 [Capricornis sumatraensis]|uniref:guanine nucleotide exchange factor for Rab-3A isoform X4 n=1 Tax=Capricornis sumatraensis TaxID=34865 RepID=UPI003604D645
MWSGQPHPDEGHPPPLEAVPVPWKSVGPYKNHRESLGGLPETPAGEEAQGEEGPAATQLDVSRLRSSSMEIREKGSEFLKEELHKAQKELKLKDEECERLSKVREQLEQELEELTASLFEEAHRMVRDANMKQAASEKQLKEARGKIDMLQAEVTALKTLVITSTPASPNRELHPQLLSPTKAGPRKGHLRHKSTSSALCPAVCPVAGHILTPDKEGKENMCPEWAGLRLSSPNPAWGLREPLLHLTILPGQDHGRVQLFHLHPLHPARPGAAGRGAHVLGDHEAAEGDVTGQARLLPPRGLGHGPGPEGASELEITPAPRQTDRWGPGASPEPGAEWRNKWPGLRGSTEPAPSVQPWIGPQEVTSSPPQ